MGWGVGGAARLPKGRAGWDRAECEDGQKGEDFLSLGHADNPGLHKGSKCFHWWTLPETLRLLGPGVGGGEAASLSGGWPRLTEEVL